MLRRLFWLPLFGVATILISNNPAHAQSSIAVEALERLRSTSSPGLDVVRGESSVAWIGGVFEPTVGRNPAEMARDFLARHGEAVEIYDARELETLREHAHGGTTFVTLQPTYAGLPLLGEQVVVAINGGLVRHVGSSLQPWAAPTRRHTLSADDAAQAVVDWSGAQVQNRSERGWLPLANELLPVWVVTQRETNPVRDWRYIVEATTGAVLWRFDQIQRYDGYVFEPNPVVTDGEYTRVELPALTSEESLEGSYARAYQCGGIPAGDCTTYDGPCRYCGLAEHSAEPDLDGNYLYEPSEPDLEDRFAEVQAYYHVSTFNQWIEDRFDFPVHCEGDRAMNIFVNRFVPGDPQTSANAFYSDSDGDGCGDLTMGEGMGIDMAYDADVIYHEFGHAMVAQKGGLGCPPMGTCQDELGLDSTAVGLNEGFADYFSVTYTGSPSLGEHAGIAFYEDGIEIRNATNPNVCPFDLVAESHYDGLILVGTGWDLREALGADVSDWLMFHTLLAIPADADYAVFAAALQASADQAVEDGLLDSDGRATVEQIIGESGRGIQDCRRIIPLDEVPEGHGEEYLILYSFMGMTLPAGLQWSLTAPPTARELRFWLEERPDSPPGFFRAHVRRGEPVNVSLEFNRTTMTMDLTWTEDYVMDLRDEEFVLTPETEPPLEGGATYYIALEYTCTSGCALKVRGDVVAPPNDPPVADGGGDHEVAVGATVELDGSASFDPQEDELRYEWRQIGGTRMELEGTDGELASFVAEEERMYTFQLTVTDEVGASDEDVVYVFARAEDDESDLDSDGGGADCSCRSARIPQRPSWARLLDLF